MKTKKTAKKPAKFIATLDAWALELDYERRTLVRILKRSDIEIIPGHLYRAREVVSGLMGSEQVERVRNLKLDADRKEREELEACGRVVEWDRVEAQLNQKVFLPLLSALDAAPAGVSAEWVEKVLKPILRQKVDAPKPA
jgi:hypothetical protein